MELVNQRVQADWLRSEYAASERRVCGLMGMAVASYRYRTTRSDEPLRTQLVELARSKPRFGYRRLHVLLRRDGEQVNHKRVHRVYQNAGLMIRRKKRKHCVREGLVAHPFALLAKGWDSVLEGTIPSGSFSPARKSKSQEVRSRDSHPCKERKDGPPISDDAPE